ncbi:protein disulfide-isomerase A5 isoform X2 [Amblyraja radiata]|uniref:protein disulfide-isomerase A5 isoform X2 n=1 Tax=Amblyraja radiata TaxID=386614 RepID=UPI0014037067|nr:protein disulfide-isomerase A5 isoform X2 [Amblyraja radiata]
MALRTAGSFQAAWFLLLALLPLCLRAAKVSPLIEKIDDQKELKKLTRTRNNVLILFSKSGAAAERPLKLLSDVAEAVKGQGTIAWVDCGNSDSRKLCKKVKVDPASKKNGVEMLHYKDGGFHVEYGRPETFKSMVAFMKDPDGAPLWEEKPEAKDVVHIDSEKEFRKLTKKEERPMLMMFYAPWCGVCKRMMPAFEQAATQMKGAHVMVGMNVHPSEFDELKQEFNVKGYPTFCYFEKGKFLFNFENYGATAQDFVEWMETPQAPQPKASEVSWAEQDSAVYHLTDDGFDEFLGEHSSALVMFYAPWCGHCKKMKPDYEEAAELLNSDSNSPGVLAAVDVTTHKNVGERYQITGFPTLKYFENTEDKWTLPHLRTKDKIIEWLHNPQAPPPPEQSWDEQQTSVAHLGVEDFKEFLKKKKQALVMFYAPWCPHCKNTIPHFTTAADHFKEERKVAFAAVDCTKGGNHELCKLEAVEGYPMISYYNYGKFTERYSEERSEEGFIGYVRRMKGQDHERTVKTREEL